jgi:hypothetical protein
MAGTASLTKGYTPPNSFGSAVVNGQLVGFQTKSGYYPLNYGGGLSAVPSASPMTMAPSAIGYGLGTVPAGRTSSNTGSSGSSGFTGSVAMWAIGAMIFGLVWLRFVHWRKPKAESPSED